MQNYYIKYIYIIKTPNTQIYSSGHSKYGAGTQKLNLLKYTLHIRKLRKKPKLDLSKSFRPVFASNETTFPQMKSVGPFSSSQDGERGRKIERERGREREREGERGKGRKREEKRKREEREGKRGKEREREENRGKQREREGNRGKEREREREGREGKRGKEREREGKRGKEREEREREGKRGSNIYEIKFLNQKNP